MRTTIEIEPRTGRRGVKGSALIAEALDAYLTLRTATRAVREAWR